MSSVCGLGGISFVVVGMLWLLSALTHRPIFGDRSDQFSHVQDGKEEILDEEQAAVTAATWIVLHPPS